MPFRPAGGPVVLLLAFALGSGAGCGTIGNHASASKTMIYGGVVTDGACVANGLSDLGGWPIPGWLFALLGVVDFPMSLGADTLCLPWDIYAMSKR